MTKKGTYYITTLGCPKNQADSREMERDLTARGLVPVSDPSLADYHIINTCAFINDAKSETIDTLLEAAAYRKDHRPSQKLVLAGCFSEKYKSVITEELPEADIHFGTGHYGNVSEILFTQNPAFFRSSTGYPEPAPLFSPEQVRNSGVRLLHHGNPYAPLKISDGCSRSCAFCAIPFIRGKFHSLPEEKILKEVDLLTKEGVREILIVSQDTASFADGDPLKLADLIEKTAEKPDVSWIRLMYLYPDAKSRKLLEEIHRRNITKVVPYLESPVQHVSQRMLKKMGRSGDYQWLKDYFTMARDLWPDLEIRTAFLVGYPGETEDDAEELHRFLDDIAPEKLAFFAYSPEEETPAGTAIEKGELELIPEDTVNHRIQDLRSHFLKLLTKHHEKRVDRVYTCMVDEVTPEIIYARRGQDAPEADEQVQIETKDLKRIPVPGELIQVKITGFYEFDMTGIITG